MFFSCCYIQADLSFTLAQLGDVSRHNCSLFRNTIPLIFPVEGLFVKSWFGKQSNGWTFCNYTCNIGHLKQISQMSVLLVIQL